MTRRKPTKIGGSFSPRLVEMLESPAHRVLSLSARRVINRLEIELASHGGTENGNLQTTYEQFVDFGIHRHSIASAIRELVALGFLEVTEKGRAGNAEFRRPNRFRITFRNTDRADATHDWRKVASAEEAQSLAKAARSNKNSSAGFCHVSVMETDTENQNPRCRKPSLLPIVRKPSLLSISRGGDRPQAKGRNQGRTGNRK